MPRKWKLRLQHCGFDLGNGEILTNVRYADDLMLYAKHCDELVFMMELLIEELSAVGLHLNTSKTKILTTTALTDRMFLDVGGDMIEVVRSQETHKYLGKKLPGDLSARAMVDVKHRIHIAWMKFNQHRETLLNRHVSLKLRLKFFDSIISPAILFGLTTVPLSAAQLSNLDIVRRRMLRSIVGWVPVVNGDWHDAMSRMNQKLQNAYRIYPTKSWPERILRGKFRFAAKIACKVNHWPVLCSRWQPGYLYERNFHVQPRRRPGRPPKRWDDQLRVFSEHVFHSSWTTAARHGAQWLSHEQAFVQFCSEA